MADIEDGLYAYRFRGFAQDGNLRPNFLAGIGTLRLAKGELHGEQSFIYIKMSDGAEPPVHGRFHVSGTLTWSAASHTGSAALTFEQLDVLKGDAQTLMGGFALVQADGNRLWIISKDKTLVQNGVQQKEVAHEAVEGELVRISA